MKIRSAILCAYWMVCLAAGACSPAVTQPTPLAAARQPVRICYTANSGAQIVVWYAVEKGLFQKYGLEPELSLISGGTNSAAALLGRQVDFCQSAGPSIINAAAGGGDVVLIEGFYDKYLFDLVVGPDIHSAQDLIGKTIAVGTPKGVKDMVARLALAHLGLQPDIQVALQSFKDNDEPVIAAAVENGSMAGAILAPPLTNQYRSAGLHVLLDISTLDEHYLRLGLTTTRSYLKEHHDIALAMVKATVEAIALIKHDPEGTQAVLAKYLKLDPVAEASSLGDFYDIYATRYLASLPYPSDAAVQAVIKEAAANNPDAGKITVAQVVDTSVLREVEDSGFIDSLPK
jgi:NitT/TauT family transport system substrate-binding protein